MFQKDHSFQDRNAPVSFGPSAVNGRCLRNRDSVSQSVISRSLPALTPPPARSLAPPLPESRSNTSTEYSLPGATQL